MNMEEIINELIVESDLNTDNISDGYHTFGELYAHRIELYLFLCRYFEYVDGEYGSGTGAVWMSKKHCDGQEFVGWFVLGVGKKKGEQITYHIPNDRWDECAQWFEVRERAYEFDGHSSSDVLGLMAF